MSVLIFKIPVSNWEDIKALGKWNFDLEDCDRNLRMESTTTQPISIISILAEKGYSCTELD